MQAIWGDIWKHTVEESQTIIIYKITQLHAVWRDIENTQNIKIHTWLLWIIEYMHCSLGKAPKSNIVLWRKQGYSEIKVCKKCPKVNPYCNAIFDPILFKPFLDGAKLPKFCAKYFFVKKVKYWVCFFHLSVKHREGLVGELWNSHHVCFMSWTETTHLSINIDGSDGRFNFSKHAFSGHVYSDECFLGAVCLGIFFCC